MKSVASKTVVELIEKKSRFIGLLYHVENLEEINALLESARKEYPNANHYTYAYILDDNQQKYSDDGEPSRTAGYPILEVVKNNNVNYCLLIVIRYFGGILLGAGGLIRAYSQTAALAMKETFFTKKITTYTCEVTCDYDYLGNIDRIVREQTKLLNVDYGNQIVFTLLCNELNLEDIRNKLFNSNNYQDKLKIISEEEIWTKTNH
ncbi:MAG: YigZ family protein [Candidatus Izemoplasmatales bacterium]|jgi:uncharacterized YigZ family protein|nr:YigZ family protein [Candidatus Izemoplasmatales bacterium]MDD4069647.1 YigZ family protein [Candidatus Izemoplasmatales bacterium]